MLTQSRSLSTHKSWDLAQRRYTRFCDSCNVPAPSRWPPASSVLLAFTAFLFSRTKLSHGVAKTSLGAVRSICKFMDTGTEAFDSPLLDYALDSYRKLRPPVKRRKRAPVTTPVLRLFHKQLHRSALWNSAIKAATALMLYALLRPQDASVTSRDTNWYPLRSWITWENNRFIFFLPRSKTDRYEEGVEIPVYANLSDTCPWRLVLDHRLLAPLQEPQSPLFQVDSSGSPLTYKHLLSATKLMAQRSGASGLTKWYSPHSYRIGGATSLAMAREQDSTIKIGGRWSSLSYQLYTRPSDALFQRISNAIASVPSPAPDEVFGPNGYGGTDPSALLSTDLEDIHMVINSRSPGKA